MAPATEAPARHLLPALPLGRSAYGKEHYAANRQRYIDQAAIVRRRVALERSRYLIEFFRSHPCADCGEGDPVVLEFDHLRDKSFDIGTMLCARDWETILAEIAKCDVVCANCHRRRTARRRAVLTGAVAPQERATRLELAL